MKNINRKLLKELAGYYGIQTSYKDTQNKTVKASNKALIKILKNFNVNITSNESISLALKEAHQLKWKEIVPPISVVWNGENGCLLLRLKGMQSFEKINCRIIYEDSSEFDWQLDLSQLAVAEVNSDYGQTYYNKIIQLPVNIPFGYHHLQIQFKDEVYRSLILSAPSQLYSPAPSKKYLGLFAPIYALHSKTSIGCGDLHDFTNLMDWSYKNGMNFIATLPFHAAFLDDPVEPSPYSPVSRLFWNELYLDITQLKECPAQKEIKKLSDRINYQKTMQMKRAILKKASEKFFLNKDNQNQIVRFMNDFPDTKQYALFRAKSAAKSCKFSLEKNEVDESDYQYHLYVQYQMHLQLSALQQNAKQKEFALYLDMPLGVHPHGYDVFAYQDQFAVGVSAGAPPDTVFKSGQTWNITPLHPLTMRKANYQYFINCLRAIMPYVNLLRIDHVMSLQRLFWIPDQCEPKDGAYVQYYSDELYAILSIESHRHEVALIGENLGTVPLSVNKMMKKHGLNQMFVLQYVLDEERKLLNIPKQSIASLNTHDMPTFFAYCKQLDLEMAVKLGILKKEKLKEASKAREKNIEYFKEFLSNKKLISENINNIEDFMRASLTYLAKSHAQYCLINIEDLWLEKDPQNIPTTKENDLNWQRRLKFSMEEIADNDNLASLLKSLSLLRKDKKTPITPNKNSHKIAEINQFSLLTSDDLYWFNEGNHFHLYQKLGAHLVKHNGVQGVYFAVWAPNANKVSVVGNFNEWNPQTNVLKSKGSSGIWEGFIPHLTQGELYKYYIQSNYLDYKVLKADPFGFYHEIPPKTASIVWDLKYEWHDETWMINRAQLQNRNAPMSIYEVHLGSWQRKPEENHRFLTYRELAPLLAQYVKNMGYTHIELLPIMEHPYFNSWGYQITGYYAPTSRYGNPTDFMYFVDYMHQQDIGVILDWVPSHFPNDEHGLSYFDGTHLFEHADPRKGFHPDWKSAIFNYGRNEIRAFLISNAFFWLDKFHIDAIRVDAVASMLYLDYSRKYGEWIPNKFGGRENLEAVAFLKKLNEEIYKYYPDVQTIAEESTAWAGVSRPTYLGGLGFGFKWDMGWMHDTLKYLNYDPIYRTYHHNEITFRMIYAFTENFILPLSHDEVVHGKGSLFYKMSGNHWEKFANLRLLFGYMYSQPGKKLLFMGNDFAQLNEWNNNQSLDWHLLSEKSHQAIQSWIKKLNEIYRTETALHELDCEPMGFKWIDSSDYQQSILVYSRRSPTQNQFILIVMNATPVVRTHYRLGVPAFGNWKILANSDENRYGGSDVLRETSFNTENIPFHYQAQSIELTIPPLSIIYLKWNVLNE